MMRKLKLSQNAKAKSEADAKAKQEVKNIDIMDAGPYGRISSEVHQNVTKHLREMQERRDAGQESSSASNVSNQDKYPSSQYQYKSAAEIGCIPYAQLTGSAASLPEGINPRLREDYLSEQDLCTVFNVSSRTEYDALPKLQRDKLKQQKQLFN